MDRCSAERIVRTCHQPVNLQRPERSVPRVSDSNAEDLDRSAASLHVLKPRHCKPAFDKVGDHVAVEPMDEHEQLIGRALRITAEQLQRTALILGLDDVFERASPCLDNAWQGLSFRGTGQSMWLAEAAWPCPHTGACNEVASRAYGCQLRLQFLFD